MSFWTNLRNAAEDITGLVTTGGFVNHGGVSNPAKTLGNISGDVKGLTGMGGGDTYEDPASRVYDPFRQYRGEFGSTLASLQRGDTQFSPSDPSYQFRFNQGQQAVERSLAARGMLGSGNELMELQKYGQDMASQEYGTEWNRLASLAGVGNVMGVGSTNMGNQLGQNLGSMFGLWNSFSGGQSPMAGLSSLFGGSAAGLTGAAAGMEDIAFLAAI